MQVAISPVITAESLSICVRTGAEKYVPALWLLLAENSRQRSSYCFGPFRPVVRPQIRGFQRDLLGRCFAVDRSYLRPVSSPITRVGVFLSHAALRPCSSILSHDSSVPSPPFFISSSDLILQWKAKTGYEPLQKTQGIHRDGALRRRAGLGNGHGEVA